MRRNQNEERQALSDSALQGDRQKQAVPKRQVVSGAQMALTGFEREVLRCAVDIYEATHTITEDISRELRCAVGEPDASAALLIFA